MRVRPALMAANVFHEKTMTEPAASDRACDVLVVGGGINGVGIARDAAGRGYSVILAEQDDLASATSSASTKLIHGGLRYLEYYEFRLVREALREREVLLAGAPHIIRPLRFVLPHDRSLRPAWMIQLGLLLYDNLGGRRTLPGSRRIDLDRMGLRSGLRPEFRIGFEYSDCWVDDARLVALNALDADLRGASILTRTRCESARREAGGWVADLLGADGRATRVRAKALVNATGPWVGQFIERRLGQAPAGRLRLVKGSHIVVPRLYQGDHAFILQNVDRRIVFTIPYERDFTLIGTTDVPFDGDPAKVVISEDESRYLRAVIERHFDRRIQPADVVWHYAGVRPLFDDDASANPSAVTRDYVLDLAVENGDAPLLNIFGGKITTYRRLSEQAVDKLTAYFPGKSGPWTAQAPLPGGDLEDGDFARFLAEATRRWNWLGHETVERLARAYGTRIELVLNGARGRNDLGPCFGADLYERELAYLARHEWARRASDALWRRSKLGLRLSLDEAARVESWFAGSNAMPEQASAQSAANA
jgi:glycerol-3-phosphate dehydrogenase